MSPNTQEKKERQEGICDNNPTPQPVTPCSSLLLYLHFHCFVLTKPLLHYCNKIQERHCSSVFKEVFLPGFKF